MAKKKRKLKISKALDEIIEEVIEAPARAIMDRVGLTDEDMASIPMCSFEEFNKHLNKIMEKKKLLKDQTKT